jgi:hypothetical protein
MAEVTTPGGTLSQQIGGMNAYIDKFLPLSIDLARVAEPKLTEILRGLAIKENISKNYVEILRNIIDACRCSKYTHRRILGLYETEIIQTTHPKEIT